LIFFWWGFLGGVGGCFCIFVFLFRVLGGVDKTVWAGGCHVRRSGCFNLSKLEETLGGEAPEKIKTSSNNHNRVREMKFHQITTPP